MTTTTDDRRPTTETAAGDALLAHLHRGGAWAHYWTDKGRESQWFPVENRPPVPAKWAGQNVYVSVHPCREIPPTNAQGKAAQQRAVRVQNDFVAAVNCVFAEYDAKEWEGGKDAILAHLDSFPQGRGWPYPSVIVDSGGGFHCYWFLEHPIPVTDDNRATLRAIQAAWVQLVGGDEASKDFARVLRVPGTLNMKPDYGPDFPTVTVIEAGYQRFHRLEDFDGLTAHLRQQADQQPTPTTQHRGYTFTDDVTKAAANLKRLRPGRAEDYQEWVNVGMALSELGAAGLGLWEDWSQQSSKYRPGECSKKWPGFTPGGGLGLGSLAHWADEDDPPAARAHVNGTGPMDVPRETADPLTDLLTQLAGVEDEREALMLFALDNVPALAALEKADFLKFCVQLAARDIPAEWVRAELRPAVNGERKAQSTTPTWTDYVEAAQGLGYKFKLNDLSDTVEANGERMTDVHEAVLLSKLHAQGLKNADVARRAFTAAAAQQRYHPVKEYLEGLKWDGQDHIARLAGYFTDKHEPIIYADGKRRTVFHAFFRRWLVGAVGKVYDPTTCQNPMLILAGWQGKGKSYFVKWLCPLPGLHIEQAIRPEDKDYTGYLTSHWIWEVGELGATIRKADREALKAFITLQDATFRSAYGRHPLKKPALASFIGTVNPEGSLLSDPTGHRRFWPVELVKTGESIDWRYAQEVDVHQLWAQAYALYRGGEAWMLCPEERAAHAEIVELYEVEDILAEYVQEHFRVEPDNPALYTHTTAIIDTLRTYGGAKGSDKGLAMQLATSLTGIGLVKAKRDNRWGYVGIAKRTE